MSVLVIFCDGVGLGLDDPSINPLVRTPTPMLRGLLGGPLVLRGVIETDHALLIPTDATLSVPGTPQSATGQTTLLTGVNAAAAAGRHVSAYPTAELRALLERDSLFAVLGRRGARVALANVYSPEFFAAVAARRLRIAAVTYAAQAAGVRLRSLDDQSAGQAVFHDLTNARLRQWGHDVPEVTAFESGRRLAAIAQTADLTFFEFFLTDLAAHGRISMTPDQVVEMLDALVAGAVAERSPATTMLLVSDHGNLEDGRTPLHTTNPVPTLAIGPGREAFRRVTALTDVAPAIVAFIDASIVGRGLERTR